MHFSGTQCAILNCYPHRAGDGRLPKHPPFQTRSTRFRRKYLINFLNSLFEHQRLSQCIKEELGTIYELSHHDPKESHPQFLYL